MALDVFAIDGVVNPTGRVGSVSALQAGAGLLGAGSVSGTQFDGASIVTLSPLSQLLAATAVFQAQQEGTTQQLSGGAFSNMDFADFASNVNLFVGAFNNFQTNSGGALGSSFDLAFNSALSFALQADDTQNEATVTQSIINGLASIGINYQATAGTFNPSQFQINWATLEAAFNANPIRTSALLSNAFQMLSSVEASIATAKSTQDQYLFASQFGLLTNSYAQNADAALQSIVDEMTNSPTSTPASNATNADTRVTTAPDIASATSLAQSPTLPMSELTVITTAIENPSAELANPVAATSTSTNANASVATNAPPGPALLQITMDPVQTDPLIASAVAAYRIGEAVANTRSDIRNITTPDPDEDIARIYRTDPVTLDLHEGDGGNGA